METYRNCESLCVEGEDSYLPPGFRFHPTDEELIIHYLLRKVLDSNFTGKPFAEVDLNKCEPWELPGKAKIGEKEWYVFSLKDRKYPTGLRTNRATNAGYWKATGKDREIYTTKTNSLVGMKKTLVFYRGRAPKGEKTNWIMHEFRLQGKFTYHYLSTTGTTSKDEWVISRVFHKNIPAAATTITGAGGGWKKITTTTHQQLSSSSSSVSLPPLLETSATSANSVTTDHESGSTKLEHVSCFSNPATSSGFNSFSWFDIPPPPPSPQPLTSPFSAGTFSSLLDMSSSSGGGGGFGRAPPQFAWSGFPKSLQEHLQFPPSFFPAANIAPPVNIGGDALGHYGSYSSNWAMGEDQKPTSNELDSIWGF